MPDSFDYIITLGRDANDVMEAAAKELTVSQPKVSRIAPLSLIFAIKIDMTSLSQPLNCIL
jgi:hypothetical protein